MAMGSNNGLTNLNKGFVANNNSYSNFNFNENRPLKDLVGNNSIIVAPEPEPSSAVQQQNPNKNNSKKPKSSFRRSNFPMGLMNNDPNNYNTTPVQSANTSFASVENTSPYDPYWITHPGSSMPRPIIRKPLAVAKKVYRRSSRTRRSSRRRSTRRAHRRH